MPIEMERESRKEHSERWNREWRMTVDCVYESCDQYMNDN